MSSDDVFPEVAPEDAFRHLDELCRGVDTVLPLIHGLSDPEWIGGLADSQVGRVRNAIAELLDTPQHESAIPLEVLPQELALAGLRRRIELGRPLNRREALVAFREIPELEMSSNEVEAAGRTIELLKARGGELGIVEIEESIFGQELEGANAKRFEQILDGYVSIGHLTASDTEKGLCYRRPYDREVERLQVPLDAEEETLLGYVAEAIEQEEFGEAHIARITRFYSPEERLPPSKFRSLLRRIGDLTKRGYLKRTTPQDSDILILVFGDRPWRIDAADNLPRITAQVVPLRSNEDVMTAESPATDTATRSPSTPPATEPAPASAEVVRDWTSFETGVGFRVVEELAANPEQLWKNADLRRQMGLENAQAFNRLLEKLAQAGLVKTVGNKVRASSQTTELLQSEPESLAAQIKSYQGPGRRK